jgi:hypothetical protein
MTDIVGMRQRLDRPIIRQVVAVRGARHQIIIEI